MSINSFSQNGPIDLLGQTPPIDSAIILKTDLIPDDHNIFAIALSPLEDELFLGYINIANYILEAIKKSRCTDFFLYSKVKNSQLQPILAYYSQTQPNPYLPPTICLFPLWKQAQRKY